MPNILDVAALAGVSRTTVSRVINQQGRVDEATRQKVHQAMQDLGYQPSRIAQSLRKQRTNMIAVLVPRISNPFYSALMQGIEREAAKYNFHVILCNTDHDPNTELKYLNMIKHQQIDGIIMASICNEHEVVKPFETYGPLIMVCEYTENDRFPSVTVDYYKAAYTATEHLLKLGHRRVGMIGGLRRSPIARDREAGFRQALHDYQIQVNEAWIKESSYSIANGEQYVKELLASHERPTAVFAGNDELAIGVIQGAKQLGLIVPKDMAVVGFDGQFIGTIVEPRLTTIVQPIELLGSTAVSILIKKILSESMDNSQRIILQSTLSVNDSCGANL